MAIKYGDLFELGKHKLLCGDATKAEDIKKLLGDEEIDLIFTDPPYNMGKKSKTTSKVTMSLRFLTNCG